MDKTDLLALYLRGPTVTGQVLDPLAVLLFDNRPYISTSLIGFRQGVELETTKIALPTELTRRYYHSKTGLKEKLKKSKVKLKLFQKREVRERVVSCLQ